MGMCTIQSRSTTHGVCGLCRDACSTSFDGAATRELLIVDVALMQRDALPQLMVPPVTLSPTSVGIGRVSLVNMISSNVDLTSTTTTSTRTQSHELTINSPPTCTFSTTM